ncbi:hypothetical protein [Paenibacillus tyrfis]|uniref:hypothetical protein n=1 Tax=Paenibacillus tyrfis TaxID=1501230 RepID=UPI00209D8566|nr:hypothetical protein [Paenibacillus tyrfis]MCP1306963.1 hypothetical protein [Paenibacillus tyrfis]
MKIDALGYFIVFVTEPFLNYSRTIIDTWMSPAWKELDAKRQEAEQAGDGTAAAAYEQQADYIHWLGTRCGRLRGRRRHNRDNHLKNANKLLNI